MKLKKTQKIQLVLVTAVLASCNREIIPSMAAEGDRPDPTLTAPPLYSTLDPVCTCEIDRNRPDSLNSYHESYSFHPMFPSSMYFPGDQRRFVKYGKEAPYVSRGGFGKSAVASTIGDVLIDVAFGVAGGS